MSIRDHVVQINQEATRHIDRVCDALFTGIEWVAPFTPWIAGMAFIVSLTMIWIGG